jgi:aspartate aminotransferase
LFLILALIDPGDEVVIPAPYWVSYPDMVLLADGAPVTVYAGPEQGYKITPEQLDAAITPKTRLFILNSPSNPTGAAYSRAELRALGDVLMRHPQVVICTDDIYEHIYWGEEPFSTIAQVCPELYERTVTVNGVSKAYAMTGWRIGYCGAPAEIATAMATIQGQSTSNASTIAQKASVVALNADQAEVRTMVKHFRQRHDYIVEALNRLPGVACQPMPGTFYAFARVDAAMKLFGAHDDNTFAEYLLNHAGVAVVPGSGFGAPGHMRLSYACSMQTLEEAVRRIEKVLKAAQAA